MTTKEYNIIVDDYSDRLYRYVLKIMKDADASMDIVQESFEKLWKNREKVEFEKAGPWLFKTSYNAVIDVKRKGYRQVYTDTLPEQGEERNYSDLKEILNEALSKINERQRTAIILRDYEGYSYQEIGEIMKLNEGQVKITIYRGRVALKEYIGALDVVI
ncbi:RNA polymerase sigma factor [Saccharicrinis sp. FJH2]|uniref:RNA polymerase sigma factor n=1 Tax=Saccharicrinis sp. FJH65 TaxID=3344659 RepID=UPI0035F3DC5B